LIFDVLLLIFCNFFQSLFILASTIDYDLRQDFSIDIKQDVKLKGILIFQLKSRSCMTEIILKNYLTLEDIFALRSTCKEFENLIIIEKNEVKTICDIPMVSGLYRGSAPKWYTTLDLEQKTSVDMFLMHSTESSTWLDNRLKEKSGSSIDDVKELTNWYFLTKKMSQIKNENLSLFKKCKNHKFHIKNKGVQGMICALLTNSGDVHFWGPDYNRQLKVLTNVKKLVTGTKAIFALTNDQTVFGWGDLGPERGTPILTPTPKVLFKNVVDLCCVDFGVAVLKTDKTVEMYGNSFVVSNDEGMMFNVRCLLTATSKICSSDRFFFALKKNGRIVVWGDKMQDELGDIGNNGFSENDLMDYFKRILLENK